MQTDSRAPIQGEDADGSLLEGRTKPARERFEDVDVDLAGRKREAAQPQHNVPRGLEQVTRNTRNTTFNMCVRCQRRRKSEHCRGKSTREVEETVRDAD